MHAETDSAAKKRIAAVIPCYRETERILGVLAGIGDEVERVYVIDDACPDGTGDLVEEFCSDPRVTVLKLSENKGVGGATLAGYRQAIDDKMDVIVKLDGDGQMNPKELHKLVRPIVNGQADYTKGNRFHSVESVSAMPKIRLFGNLFLSFATKMSSGYWNIFDPTNGYTAIDRRVAELLPFAKIDNGYFFESDMLFRLNTLRAVVADVPIPAIYGDERSSLVIWKILMPFLGKNIANTFRRLVYSYFLRDFTVASVELVVGLILIGFAVIFGGVHWYDSITTNVPASTGIIILPTLTFLVGIQLFLGFMNFDTRNVPTSALHLDL